MNTSRVQLALVATLVGLCTWGVGVVDGAEAMYVFGDSYLDTGNINVSSVPFGITWPGYPADRYSNGRVFTDYFAELFGLPTPTPYLQFVRNSSGASGGLNFARSGAAVGYAFGVTEFEVQVDEMEALLRNGTLTQHHLKKSVAVINIGLNDYNVRNNFGAPFQVSPIGVQELQTFVQAVVNGVVVAMVRLHSLGIRNMVVLNLPPLQCMPFSTGESALAFQACSTNPKFINETAVHNSLLQARVRGLNQQLQGLHAVIANQEKAFTELLYDGNDYGFENLLTPCCYGNNASNLYSFNCGALDEEGKPLYTLCSDPNKAVLFDTIHPSQAGYKALLHLYATVSGYTLEGPKLQSWISKYNV